jgi:hypothetical protein
MKKIGILLILITGLFLQEVRSLDFGIAYKANGVWNNVPNGGSIVFTCKKSAFIDQYLKVKNNTAGSLCVNMCKSYAQKSANPFNDEFCWDRCYPQQITKSEGCLPFTAGQQDTLHCHLTYTPQGSLGETVIKYTFWVNGTAGDSVSVIVHFNSTETGINDLPVATATASPNPCGGNCVFSFESLQGEAGKLVISNILGNKMLELELSPGQNQITADLSFLPEGVYLYRYERSGAAGKAKKLVIRK